MRYQAWDVILFPDNESKAPQQEFKTSCQVVQDPESHMYGPSLLPTVTSFIPGLPEGAPFRISIHTWVKPEFSRYIRSIQKPGEILVYETRLYIDGKLVTSKWYDEHGPWPSILNLADDLDKQGEPLQLKFPPFHREILSQSFWNAADDLGRIKLVISEGISRDDNSVYPQRYKNVVAFSFQHAPLDVLETSSIAWPNTAMWRMPYGHGGQFSPQRSSSPVGKLTDHAHTPRPAAILQKKPILPPVSIYQDPFVDNGGSQFQKYRNASNVVSESSTIDVSMRTGLSSESSRNVSDPMIGIDRRCLGGTQNEDQFNALIEALNDSSRKPSRAPDNTPTETLKFATGHKRQRIITPMSSKVIDPVDEPTSSASPNIPNMPVGRRVLSELSNGGSSIR